MSIEKREDHWLARILVNGNRTSRMFDTKREARAWEAKEKFEIEEAGRPKGDGPEKNCLGQAMFMFAETETKFKKGYQQELSRLNKWRLAADLPRLKFILREDGGKDLVEMTTAMVLPRTLAEHRAKRAEKSAKADTPREKLARMPMSDITGHCIRDFEVALRDAGLSADTVRLELALLKRIFNVSRDIWNWRYKAFPFRSYKMPSAGQPRDRRVPPEKQTALFAELAKCKSPFMLPYVQLAIETTMRRGEVLFTTTWDDVDLDKRIIHLRTDKAGSGREVMLSKNAVELLQRVQKLPTKNSDSRLFPLTANQLQSAWRKACLRADITDLRIHDLRHEGTSLYALRLHGNPFLLKKITGHRSLQMLSRYVNISAEELLRAMDSAAPLFPSEPSEAADMVPLIETDAEEAGNHSATESALKLVVGGN